MARFKEGFLLLKETISKWQKDRVAQAAGSLAFFTIFSLAPLLIIAIGIAGMVFGNQAAREKLLEQIQFMLGPQAVQIARRAIENVSAGGKDIIGTLIGTGALIFGATTVFAQLQGALNQMWRVQEKPGKPLIGFLRTRLVSFVMVLLIGILLCALLLVSAVLSATSEYIKQYWGNITFLMRVADIAVSLGIATVLFALIFKLLPDVRIRWRDVWVGSLPTSLLFTVSKFLISLYFSRSTIANAYGAAGSLVVLLIWVYFSAQILFLGAEFTHVHARKRGKPVEPSGYAQKVS